MIATRVMSQFVFRARRRAVVPHWSLKQHLHESVPFFMPVSSPLHITAPHLRQDAQEARRRQGMLKRMVLTSIALLMTVLLGAIPLQAVAASSATPAVLQSASLLHKVTIWGETSIDGPALSSRVDTFEGVTNFNTVLAWTGTDSLHHLNLLKSSTDPAVRALRFGSKLTLHETSFAHPAVIQMSPASGGVTILAWTGTDAAHTLNVLWNAYDTSGQHQVKLTLWGETSIGAPALAFWQNSIVLAWTGTDANHSLNVLPLSFGTLQRGSKVVLPQFSSLTGPDLSVYSNAASTQLVLNWTTKAQHLNQAYSTDGVRFTSALGSVGTPQLSAKAPASVYHQREGGPEYWMAWTGTDGAHHLNLQWTTKWPQWPDPTATKTVLGDTALGGPQVAFNDGFLIAWTGTDGAHTLNVATWEGF